MESNEEIPDTIVIHLTHSPNLPNKECCMSEKVLGDKKTRKADNILSNLELNKIIYHRAHDKCYVAAA